MPKLTKREKGLLRVQKRREYAKQYQSRQKAYYNEIDSFPCRVIERNIERGRLPKGRVHCADIRDVQPDDLRGYGQIHLFAGIGVAAYACRLAGLPDGFSICTLGFPCQDLSTAGKGEGLDGARSGLFFEALRLIAAVKPTWLLIENVPALRTRGIDRVIEELEAIGYIVLPPTVVGADDVGATHRRKRVWIVARRADEFMADPDMLERWTECDIADVSLGKREAWNELDRSGFDVDDSGSSRREQLYGLLQTGRDCPVCPSQDVADAKCTERGPESEAGISITDGQDGRRDETPSQPRAFGTDERIRSLAHADSNGLSGISGQTGCGKNGPELWTDSNGESHGLADAQSLGVVDVCGSSRDVPESGIGTQRPYRQPCPRCGELADSNSTGQREQCAAEPVPSELITSECCGNEFRWNWPARPGEDQYDWEEPRTIKSEVGSATDGTAKRLVRSFTSWRRNALKGLGNAWVPQTAVPIIQWIHETEKQLLQIEKETK